MIVVYIAAPGGDDFKIIYRSKYLAKATRLTPFSGSGPDLRDIY